MSAQPCYSPAAANFRLLLQPALLGARCCMTSHHPWSGLPLSALLHCYTQPGTCPAAEHQPAPLPPPLQLHIMPPGPPLSACCSAHTSALQAAANPFPLLAQPAARPVYATATSLAALPCPAARRPPGACPRRGSRTAPAPCPRPCSFPRLLAPAPSPHFICCPRPCFSTARAPTWFLSTARVTNWLRTGGTLRRMESTRRWRWMRTYLGHFTKRCTSRLGGGAPPRPVGGKEEAGGGWMNTCRRDEGPQGGMALHARAGAGVSRR